MNVRVSICGHDIAVLMLSRDGLRVRSTTARSSFRTPTTVMTPPAISRSVFTISNASR